MGKQYLTFTLADTVYATNVFQVREVLPYAQPQPLPNADPVIEGLIRSRGQSIPVVSLRRKFGLADRQADAASRIIVVEVNNYEEGSISVFGAVADSVNEVLDIESIGFENTPELGNSAASAFVEGIGRQDDTFIIILDVDKIFSHPELSEMSELDNRTVAPEYAQYTQELPPQRREPASAVPPIEEAPQAAEPAQEPSSEKSEAPEEAPQAMEPAQELAQPEREKPAAERQPMEKEPAQGPQPVRIAAQSLLATAEALAKKSATAQEPPTEKSGVPMQAEEKALQAEVSSTEDEPCQSEEARLQPEALEKVPPVEDEAEEPARKPPQKDSLDGRYDALDFTAEDFELL